MDNKLKNFRLSRGDLCVFGSGLTRPECVRADQEGVWASDDRGGIARVTKTGVAELRGHGVYEPNGYSRTADGAFIVAFAIAANGDLGPKELFGPAVLGHGALPDGFIFDADGNVWVTIISRNGIVDVGADGETQTIYEEPNLAAIDAPVAAMQQETATPEQLLACAGNTLKLPTSLAFGGADGRTV